MTDKKVLVSVYGTLKQGWGNHTLLSKDPITKGHIGIKKLDGVGFPIIKLGDSYRLNVEVYEVNPEELARLDSLEGYREDRKPTFYDRKTTKVTTYEGKEIETYVYEYVDNSFPNRILEECKEESGVYNWVGRRRW